MFTTIFCFILLAIYYILISPKNIKATLFSALSLMPICMAFSFFDFGYLLKLEIVKLFFPQSLIAIGVLFTISLLLFRILIDRDPMTIEQATNILWNGKSILICYPPDFSAENECDIYDSDYPIWINDIGAPGTWEKMSKVDCFKKIEDFLRGYELYR